MKYEHIINAVVTDVKVGEEYQDAIGVTLYLNLQGGGSWTFGGRILYMPNGWSGHGKCYMGLFIHEIMKVCDVIDLSKCVGKCIRVATKMKNTLGQSNDAILAIGHIINDEWFAPDEAIAKYDDAAKGQYTEPPLEVKR